MIAQRHNPADGLQPTLVTMLMKHIYKSIFIIILSLVSSTIYAQNNNLDIIKLYDNPFILENNFEKIDYIKTYAPYDFSVVWLDSTKTGYLAFIGNNYQRIRIQIFSIAKDKNIPLQYIIHGKSAINNEIRSFRGIFTIKYIKRLKKMHWGCDDKYKNNGIKAQGVLIGEYKLYQDHSLKNSGYFQGELSALWYINRNGKILFDDIESFSDPYINNQFVGSWTSYDGKKKLKSNWGDYRIPDSGDLDVGTGEFHPNKKYIKNGWESYIEARNPDNFNLSKDDFFWGK